MPTTAEANTDSNYAQPIPCEQELRRNPPALLSVSEAAIYLGISERKLREELAMKKFKTIRIGHRIILRLKDIDAVLEQLAR